MFRDESDLQFRHFDFERLVLPEAFDVRTQRRLDIVRLGVFIRFGENELFCDIAQFRVLILPFLPLLLDWTGRVVGRGEQRLT